MTAERTIFALIAGPSAGTIVPPHAGPVVKALDLEALDELGFGDDIGPATVEYVRRSYRVGGTSVHAWVYRPLDDHEAAEAMWRWLLDEAGVPA